MDEHVIETFGISDELVFTNVIFETLRETFGASDFAFGIQKRIVSETFGIQDTITGYNYVLIREVFHAQDTTSVDITARRNAFEIFRVRSRAISPVVRVSATLSDTFGAVDGTQHPTIGTILSEMFSAQDTPSGAADASTSRTLSDVFRARDQAHPKSRVYVSEVFNTSSTHYIPTANRVVVYDKASFVDTALPVRTMYVHVVDTVQISGTFVPTQTAREVAHERMRIDDRAYARVSDLLLSGDQLENLSIPLSRTGAWTADMRVWAMSRYVDFPMRDFISDQFGAGDDGLYTHNDDPVMGYIETGQVRLDNREDQRLFHKKQLRYVYTYAEYTNPLHVLVTADLNNERASAEYENTVQSSDDVRATRCEIGRGFASNYVKLRIGARSKFAISAVEVESVVSSRRV